MSSVSVRAIAPDQPQRERALDPTRSVLVQAPAGSGKTDLLTRRFLRLLAEVESPGQIVAITFTNAAAAEMRHRILGELERAASGPATTGYDQFSMDSLARRALDRSRALGWNLTELPAQLRISTIDSFCRELALQQPLLSGLGGALDIHEQPRDLYRRAARRALEKIETGDATLRGAICDLLLWRDNDWQQMEDLLVEMLAKRHRWMHYFVLKHDPGWEAVRERLERPFANAVRSTLYGLSELLDQVPNARDEALALARFACEEPGDNSPWQLAECAEIPAHPFDHGIDSSRDAFAALGAFLHTKKGTWRSEKGLKTSDGFPSTPRGREAKKRFASFITRLQAVPGLQSALAAVPTLPPARYTEEDWHILRACFTLLREAAAQLKVIFAETGTVDFIEVAQIAESVLTDENDLPSDAAIAAADGIRHLLVDEFQDTSRRQHQLLASLIGAWPEREGRTCFVVGDPMQSIYFFRDADAELFARIRDYGLQLPNDQPLLFDHAPLSANFRTTPPLVEHLNGLFGSAFANDDGSGIRFSPAEPARTAQTSPSQVLNLHVKFVPQTTGNKAKTETEKDEKEAARTAQTEEILALIRGHQTRAQEAKARGERYRIAVLGRFRGALAPIAQALHKAGIPFRAVDLENLRDRPEVLDALALARAILNPHDRLAWLGVLRAPWCGLSLADLHTLTSADDLSLLARPIPELFAERLHLLSHDGRRSTQRVLSVVQSALDLRLSRPTTSLGTWLQQFWRLLGGDACADATALANLDLLWTCIDRLPNREQDLLGPTLEAALENLTAQPDPAASSDNGVQLMTIHKSKGLEFEVVIVPELQAGQRTSNSEMLSWLERGLSEPDETGEITEFLIAPFQPKGADRGQAKQWVDAVYKEREKQEARRILYVAATRAREELHLFARPTYKTQHDGSLLLAEPKGTLLEAAWPALESDISRLFDDWAATRAAAHVEQPVTVESIAASTESNLLVMPSPAAPAPTVMRRLPPDYQVPAITTSGPSRAELVIGDPASQLYARHEGGLRSRALGTAVHALLENLARLRVTMDWDTARSELQRLLPGTAAAIRALGIGPAEAASLADRAFRHALEASSDPIGAWIFSPHPHAASEVQWTGVVAGALRSVRVDRIFQAGAIPESQGQTCWWIVDYKTAHPDGLQPQAALPRLRSLFAPQLEAYARVLRNLHGESTPIRTALYYPLMHSLDWWEPSL